MDPTVFFSGRFTSHSNWITKRGSNQLRHAIFLAAQFGLRGNVNKRLRDFYD
ncbi:transposase [Bacillus gobiensis]|uniref:transposase n=1 Tax=Bacillus gobiensis TaxID=1441095 RepID=UPI003D234332